MTVTVAASLDEVVRRMRAHERKMRRRGDPRHAFHGTYLRTTLAVREALSWGRFLDPEWVEAWATAFARFYLDALGPRTPDVWVAAFGAGPLGPRQRVLLGMHIHLTHDLPLALLEVMDDDDFRDPGTRHRRLRDHVAVDGVLASRVGVRAAPAPEAAARRLRVVRDEVWANAELMAQARSQSAAALAACRQELARLTIRRSEVLASRRWPWAVAVTRAAVRISPDCVHPVPAPTG